LGIGGFGLYQFETEELFVALEEGDGGGGVGKVGGAWEEGEEAAVGIEKSVGTY
jgi:hypothetical protein